MVFISSKHQQEFALEHLGCDNISLLSHSNLKLFFLSHWLLLLPSLNLTVETHGEAICGFVLTLKVNVWDASWLGHMVFNLFTANLLDELFLWNTRFRMSKTRASIFWITN